MQPSLSPNLRIYSASFFKNEGKKVRFTKDQPSESNLKFKIQHRVAKSLSDATILRMQDVEKKRLKHFEIIDRLKKTRKPELETAKSSPEEAVEENKVLKLMDSFAKEIEDLCNQIIELEETLYFCGLRSEFIKNAILQERLGLYLKYLTRPCSIPTHTENLPKSGRKVSVESTHRLSMPQSAQNLEQVGKVFFSNPTNFNNMVEGIMKLMDDESFAKVAKMVCLTNSDWTSRF